MRDDGTAADRGRGDAPALLLWWEARHPALQIALVGPISVALMWVIHIGPLNQPLGRGLGYAAFWGLVLTGLIVAASRAEHARRQAARRGDPPAPR
ncbi:MAG: hypothetical protein AB1416_07045 [Actinomycetota bacterium]